MSTLPSCPHTAARNVVTRHHSWERKSPTSVMENSIRLPISKSPSALSPAYKSSQAEPAPEPVQRTFLSSVLPPLCSGISLIKSVWKFLWGFCSIPILGNPKVP